MSLTPLWISMMLVTNQKMDKRAWLGKKSHHPAEGPISHLKVRFRIWNLKFWLAITLLYLPREQPTMTSRTKFWKSTQPKARSIRMRKFWQEIMPRRPVKNYTLRNGMLTASTLKIKLRRNSSKSGRSMTLIGMDTLIPARVTRFCPRLPRNDEAESLCLKYLSFIIINKYKSKI